MLQKGTACSNFSQSCPEASPHAEPRIDAVELLGESFGWFHDPMKCQRPRRAKMCGYRRAREERRAAPVPGDTVGACVSGPEVRDVLPTPGA